ncbi:MAG: tetratricopeptide repeat protein [Chloroflexi bacterium]|nr:tetratricopeptide repeat protein [Chloroflexota bacterium]
MIAIDQSSFKQEARATHGPGLARAALLFAREIAYPELRPSEWLARLDQWADEVQRRIPAGEPPWEQAQRLGDFLFSEIGLRGNREEYADPRNSYLNQVMERGLGLPISLSVIYVEVATRLGLQAAGIGLPGHFVTAVEVGGSYRYLDPFHGGAEITAGDAVRLVRESTGDPGPFRREWLSPVPPRAIVARMLANLRAGYIETESWLEAVAVVERLALLQPESPEHLRDLGLLHVRNKSLRQAVQYLERYVELRPDAPDVEAIRRSMAGKLKEIVRLN